MIYRQANAADLGGILQLYLELNPEDPPIDPTKAKEIWAAICGADCFLYFVAIDGEEIVGTCNLSIIPNLTRGGRPFALIENVVTASSHRRKGIGKGLLQTAIDVAKQRNCYKVMLMSSAKRTEAHSFYESIGFDGTSKKAFDLRLIHE